jgi:hypothetical protein
LRLARRGFVEVCGAALVGLVVCIIWMGLDLAMGNKAPLDVLHDNARSGYGVVAGYLFCRWRSA